MGRRGGAYSGCPLGNADMETAITTLNMRQNAAVALMTEYHCSRDKTIAMLFAQDTIDKATAARGIVTPDYESKSYELNQTLNFMGSIRIDFDGCKALPIRGAKLEIQQDKVQPLLDYIRAVEKVYLQYEEIKGVLRYLNQNATIGGIRYYWPSIMKVAPKNSVFSGMEKAPKRFDTPAYLYEWLQPMRDSAVTVAAMALMPEDARGRPFKQMSLTCHRRKVVVKPSSDMRSEQSYQTDSVTFAM